MTVPLNQPSLLSPATCDLSQGKKSWQASLSLVFEKRAHKTALTSARHQGPLRVQRAFYPEGPEVPHVYLLHPPGGVVAGDELSINIDIGRRAHGLVTTPSAGRIYRTNSQGLKQTQTITGVVAPEGVLEWMPQENIIFNGANGVNVNRFELHENAQLMAWDICCLGRPAGEQPFVNGKFLQSLEVIKDKKPLLIERTLVDTDSEMLSSVWGFQGKTVFATMIATIDNPDVLARLKQELQRQDGDYRLAFTQKKSLLIVRYLGHSAIQARDLFSHAWSFIRPNLIERSACEPRIWHT